MSASLMNDHWIEAMSQSVVYEIVPYLPIAEGQEQALNVPKAEPLFLTKPELITRGWYDEFVGELEKLTIDQPTTLTEQGLIVTAHARTPMIEPFFSESVKTMVLDGQEVKIPSYGLSSYGYDIRLGRNFKVFKDIGDDRSGEYYVERVADILKDSPDEVLEEFNDMDSIVIPAGSMILGVSMEKITVPDNVLAVCMAKSTLARMGIEAKVTPLEPGWSGYVTLEIANDTPNPIRIYSGIGIMQLMFFKGDPCKTTYKDRGGKYLNQPYLPVAAKL